METSLRDELLNVWYPVSRDSDYGGFLCDFTYDWKPQGRHHKMIVTQARHVWTTSQAARFYKDDRYRRIAEHGFHFLKDKMWDDRYGGFYMLRDRKGGPVDYSYQDEKRAYGNAFAIYALASYYAMSGDTSALNLAQKTFAWLEKHSHDPEYGGYFDQMARDGSWLRKNRTQAWDSPSIGWKNQNSSIHLLEAFTELYRVWPDSLLRQRLVEMLKVIRDTIVTPQGYLTLFLKRDWTPVSFRDSSEAIRRANYYYDHVSFGHDVETAYLLLEASHVLGLKSDTITLAVAKKMVDHALANGWDEQNGGFYEAGYYFPGSDTLAIINAAKTWWVQAEGLNALLLMAKLLPQEKKYGEAFRKQWAYINKYLIDHEHGEWYEEGLDMSPGQRKAPKARDWKVNYHNGRALMNCIKMLKSEHELLRQNHLGQNH
ncbi:MAG: AGE family epimerase/isomerase [candidate division KSB1 bacterium]|nr:AGE family epimerase/isomerase [candidate division KSB1 bacterium]MDZ7304186.1 AGE family epimerase/isomerase [candidate division KSB1 bacterium]MDZ7310658.1 AGE family epimerase/isomerase [candidate division KSB1 bacterium]